MTIRILGICGSLRKNSTNMGMLRYAQKHAPNNTTIEIADLAKLPFYCQDIEEKPSEVQLFFKQLDAADAFLFGCVEYNYSIAPVLKNALDWASREKDNYLLSGKTAAIMGAGGGMGSSRAQYHLRQVCIILNIQVIVQPEIFANAFSDSFDQNGDLVDERIRGLIRKQLDVLQTSVRA